MSFNKTKYDRNHPFLLETIKIAQNILKTSIKKIHPNVVNSINNFLRNASFASTRKYIKETDLIKIINIAKNIKQNHHKGGLS
jgi:hypothetical protein|tara:strand:+ start:5229 stop:5477 length:249 start_codon:yes stop_codon:yes gene_type:complete